MAHYRGSKIRLFFTSYDNYNMRDDYNMLRITIE